MVLDEYVTIYVLSPSTLPTDSKFDVIKLFWLVQVNVRDSVQVNVKYECQC